MSEMQRAELLAAARAFAAGDGFAAHLERLATVRVRNGGEAPLAEHYRDLLASGRVVEAFVVRDAGLLGRKAASCVPALVAASLLGTDAGDQAAGAASRRIPLFEDEEMDEATAEAFALTQDDAFRPFRRRVLPARLCDGDDPVYLIDVEIDRVITETNPFMRPRFFFLVDPAAGGIHLQLPDTEGP